MPVRVLLIGHGRMGKLVERHAVEHGCEIAGVVTDETGASGIAGDFGHVDVAIDFTLPEAVPQTVAAVAARGLNLVIGTTGWQAHEAGVRDIAARANIGLFAAANFSVGMNIFRFVVEEAARRYATVGGAGAWIHETHHAKKLDAPSGTALMLRDAMEQAGYTAGIDVASTRAGFVPGTHTIGFDGPSETVELTHTVRDRAVFAHGALDAARWLVGRRGWFTMRDMIAGA